MRAYRDGGYLPEAVFNYMSLLGWSYEAETTIFTRERAIERFELASVSKNPAVFDPEKLQWMNGIYIRSLDADEFCRRSRPFLERGLGRPLEAGEWEGFVALAPLVRERVRLLTEVVDLVGFMFAPALEYDEKSWRQVMESSSAAPVLEAAVEHLTSLLRWAAADIEASLRTMLEELDLNARKGLQPIRVATTGSTVSPPLFETLEVLGRDTTLERLRHARSLL